MILKNASDYGGRLNRILKKFKEKMVKNLYLNKNITKIP